MPFISPLFIQASRTRSLFRRKAKGINYYSGNPTLELAFKGPIEKELATLVSEISAYLVRVYKAQTDTTINIAKKICPVRTGALRKSLRIEKVERPYDIKPRVVPAGGGNFKGLIAVRYRLYNLSVNSNLDYWPVIDKRYGIQEEALNSAIEDVNNSLRDIPFIGRGLFTTTHVRSE